MEAHMHTVRHLAGVGGTPARLAHPGPPLYLHITLAHGDSTDRKDTPDRKDTLYQPVVRCGDDPSPIAMTPLWT